MSLSCSVTLCFLVASLRADVIDLCSGEDDTLISVGAEEEESEPSGVHGDDALNLPDPQGRVLVNLGHPAAEKDIFLLPQLARAVKPHQVFLPADLRGDARGFLSGHR